MVQEKNKILSYKEFENLWKKRREELCEEQNIYRYTYEFLIFVETYVEHFFLGHLKLSLEEQEQFGYLKTMRQAMRSFGESYFIYCYTTLVMHKTFHFKENLQMEAFTTAHLLYMEYSDDGFYLRQQKEQEYERVSKEEILSIVKEVSNSVYYWRYVAARKNAVRIFNMGSVVEEIQIFFKSEEMSEKAYELLPSLYKEYLNEL